MGPRLGTPSLLEDTADKRLSYIEDGYVDESEHQESRCSYGEDVPDVHLHIQDLF